MIGKEIIKEHDIQIKTDGWLGVVEADWGIEPLYFKPSDILKTSVVEIDKPVLGKYNVPLYPTPPKIRLFNQKDLKGIMTDNFSFETELKTSPSESSNACQNVTVLLHAKNDIMIVNLTNKGCVGDISLAAFGYYVESKTADLSGFGCTPSDWTKLKIECKRGDMTIFVNNKVAYIAKITNAPTEIVGVQYRFNGPCAVRNTWLAGKAEKVIF